MCNDEQYSELLNTIQELGIVEQITEILESEKESITKKIMNEFVMDNPRVWWLSFKKKPKGYNFDDEFQYKRINTFFADNEICYFITLVSGIEIRTIFN